MGCYCTGVGADGNPVVVTTRNNGVNTNAIAPSIFFGGAAAYLAHKYWDEIKDPMSKGTLLENIANNKEVKFKAPLDFNEQLLFNEAKNAFSSQVNDIFQGADKLTPYDYFARCYPEGNIKTVNDLENYIKAQETSQAKVNQSASTEKQKIENKVRSAEALKTKSENLSELEKQLFELEKQASEIVNKNTKGAKKGAKAQIPKNLQNRIDFLEGQRKSLATEIERLISNPDIKEAITNIDDFKKDIHIGAKSKDFKVVEEAATRRNNFFKELRDGAIESHNNILKEAPKVTDIAKMKADLQFVKAAASGDGFVTRQTVEEFHKLSKAAGEGGKLVDKLHQQLAGSGKLPKIKGNLQKAGIIGGIVALGLYFLGNSNSA